MLQKNNKKQADYRNDKGFTLLELIISIVVLVLVMLPLMNSFYRSAQMNKKAEDIQYQSNLAANIMEGLKNLDIEDTITQFKGPVSNFTVLTDGSGTPIVEDVMVLKFNPVTGKYEEVVLNSNETLSEQSAYYFAIHGIREGSTAYDALITMNSTTYTTASNILNNYQMPEAINLDALSNGLLFSEGAAAGDTKDQQALDTFLQWGEDYARQLFSTSSDYRDYRTAYDQWINDCETAQMQALPTPVPPAQVTFNPASYPGYCDVATLKQNITKTMKVTIDQAASNTVKYEIIYTCNWPSGSTLNRTISDQVSVTNYSKVLENIYLFYQPSLFKNSMDVHYDMVEVQNLTTANPVNFYLAKQAGSIALPHVKITQSDPDSITVFTNLDPVYVDSSSAINGGIVKTEQKNRIFEVKVQLYKYIASMNPADKYQEEVYTLSSSNEN